MAKKIQIITGVLLFLSGFATRLISPGLIPTILFLSAYVVLGAEVAWSALKNIAKGHLFDENFLMSAATVGALALGEFPEAAAVMLFYQVGEYFQDMAVAKSKKSIADLMDIRPDHANKLVNGEAVRVSPEDVATGDLILVKPGEKIPLDGVVTSGGGLLDVRSLTGESLPQSVKAGDPVLSGCVSLDGLLTVQVTKPFGESTVSKILELVQNAASQKAPAERFISVFARYYTPAVVGLAVLLAVIPPLFMGGWGEWLHRALIFLVITCPCALVISVPLSYFAGIGAASRAGVLVKGANYLEALAEPDIVVFDKTGTLTRGVFEVTGVYPAPGFEKEKLLRLAAYAESYSNHPVGRSIVRAYNGTVDPSEVEHYEEKTGRGISAFIGGKTVLAGNGAFLREMNVTVPDDSTEGTVVHVAEGQTYAGRITVADTLRPGSADAVRALRGLGARKLVMLTGDNTRTAEEVAGSLSLDAFYAKLLPQDKFERLEALDKGKKPGGKLFFVGDGINDAPVLARADVGIAMGGLGSDAAVEAADVVLMTDEPQKIVCAVRIARKTRLVVRQNIIFALGVKLIIMVLGALGLANMWAAVFADVGVSMLAIMNALRAMKVK